MGWVFGFCRPDIFLFKCYVFGFVEAALVFPSNVPTKSEASTPPGQFFWGRKHEVIVDSVREGSFLCACASTLQRMQTCAFMGCAI